MIPSTQEIVYRVFGTWQFARFNAGGLQYFDESRQAALRSFFAAALVAPAFAIAHLLSLWDAPLKTDEDPLVVAIVFALYYCLTWVVSPVIIHRVCVTIDRENAFFRYLSASNWASVIGVHLQLLASLLEASGVMPEAVSSLPGFAAFIYLRFFQWFITRHCLDVSPLGAVGFVALDSIVTFFIGNIAFSLIFQPAG